MAVGLVSAPVIKAGGIGAIAENLWSVLGLALVAAVAERGRIRLSPRHEESISLLPTLYAAVLAGPAAGMIVGASSFLLELHRSRARWTVYTCIRMLSGAAAGASAVALTSVSPPGVAGTLIAVGGAAAVIELIDLLLVTITGHVRQVGSGGPFAIARERLPLALAAIPFAVFVISLLVLAHTQLSGWTLPMFFVPALAAHRLYVMYQDKATLAVSLGSANTRLEGASFALASSLVAALDARDRYTAGHSAAVALTAKNVAAELGFSQPMQTMVYQSGLVHDIGKIGLPSTLLEKCGRLEAAEHAVLQSHPVIGAEILSKGDVPDEMLEAVLHHHERFDGSGYPAGLLGNDIPIFARILAVADAFDAMVSDRPYRPAMPVAVAVEELVRGSGSQFDPMIVDAFLACQLRGNVGARAFGGSGEEGDQNVIGTERLAIYSLSSLSTA
jgi:putative nucleotidyltransferase with HDIG domain